MPWTDYVHLRQRAPCRLRAARCLTRRQSFQPWLQGGAFDIVQPDVTKVGGISEERRIAWMAQENGIRFIPHGWNTAVGLAADLQLASAFRDTDLVEYLTGSPFIDAIAAGGWRLDAEGMLPIPSHTRPRFAPRSGRSRKIYRRRTPPRPGRTLTSA